MSRLRLSRLPGGQRDIHELVERIVGHGVRGGAQRMFERPERLTVGCAGSTRGPFAQLLAARLAAGKGGKVADGQLGRGAQLFVAEEGHPAFPLVRFGERSGFSRLGGYNRIGRFGGRDRLSPEKAQVQGLLFGAVLWGAARAHPQPSAWCPSASEEMRSSDHSP